MTISIIGTGYVGLTTGALLAAAGNSVYCVDIDAGKVNKLKKGKAHFYEPGLDQFVTQTVRNGRLIPTIDYKEAVSESEIAFITVGTPSNEDGSTDLFQVFEAVNEIVTHMKEGLVIGGGSLQAREKLIKYWF